MTNKNSIPAEIAEVLTELETEVEPGINGYQEMLEGVSFNPDTGDITIEGLVFEDVNIDPVRMESNPIEYLAEPYMPRGHIVGVEGEGDLGKSVWYAYVAAKVSRGEAIIPGLKPAKPGGVIYINYEDRPGDVVKARIERRSEEHTS